MNKNKHIFWLFCFAIYFSFAEQTSYAQCFIENTSFLPGEKVTYNVTYNLGFIWINAGEVIFNVDTAIYGNRKVYHLKSFGRSYNNYDWIYKVREQYETYLDIQRLKPLKCERNSFEGDYWTKEKYFADYNARRLYSFVENSKHSLIQDTLPLKQCTYDPLSAVYYVRNLDFSKYKINDKIPIRMVVDNIIYDLYIRYLGTEILTTHENKKYNCFKVSPQLIKGTVFEEGENMTVWVTNDKNRVPVMVESEILVGSVKAVLSKYEGLRYPFAAEIK